MQKVACLFSFKLSSWVSCQKIVFNLHKAYQLDKDLELLNFNYSVDQMPSEWAETADAVVEADPDIILVLDHKPHPNAILQLILPLMQRKPRIIFHVFGDFTLYYQAWEKLGKLLEGYRVNFVVASERQKILIDKFLPENNKSSVCPFPVDKSEFSFRPALRTTQRKEWGVSDSDFIFVFSGRLSRQKRIHNLLLTFNDFLEQTGADDAYLYLYGSPDHIGDTFVGKWEVEGEYFRKINRIYKGLPQSTQDKIRFMGSVPNVELRAIYQGADMLVNLSVHNDEDFGMSVAEAQCSGLPSILTDWGGLAGFYHPSLPEATNYVDVTIGEKNKLISYKQTVKALIDSYRQGHFRDRQKLSELALDKFGVEAGYEAVKQVLDREPSFFTEFTPFFMKVLRRILFFPSPYVDKYQKINKLYRELYSAYVRAH